jgi:hypothetical protein
VAVGEGVAQAHILRERQAATPSFRKSEEAPYRQILVEGLWSQPDTPAKGRGGSRRHAGELRRPAGIGCGVPAHLSRAVDHIAGRYGPVERLGIDLVTPRRSNRQSLECIGAVEFVTTNVKDCGLPSNNETERCVRLTVTSGGGGCSEAEPTAPLQPRTATAKKIAGRQRIGTLVKLLRPPNAVSHSMRQRIARALPDRSIRGNAYGVDDTIRI